jgi:hypothetical protein
MKIFLLIVFSFLVSQAMSQQRLRDSLYGGKLKADTGKTFASNDTTKYVVLKNENISSQPGEKQKTGISIPVNKPDESMPDSLNKLFYAKQRFWKKFIENNTQIISQQADDTRKVKKGTYQIDVEYEIGVNGRITTKGITCNPPNEFLLEQVTELMKRPPVLSPPIYSDGKPRTLSATQPITIVKK